MNKALVVLCLLVVTAIVSTEENRIIGCVKRCQKTNSLGLLACMKICDVPFIKDDIEEDQFYNRFRNHEFRNTKTRFKSFKRRSFDSNDNLADNESFSKTHSTNSSETYTILVSREEYVQRLLSKMAYEKEGPKQQLKWLSQFIDANKQFKFVIKELHSVLQTLPREDNAIRLEAVALMKNNIAPLSCEDVTMVLFAFTDNDAKVMAVGYLSPAIESCTNPSSLTRNVRDDDTRTKILEAVIPKAVINCEVAYDIVWSFSSQESRMNAVKLINKSINDNREKCEHIIIHFSDYEDKKKVRKILGIN